MGEVRLLVVFGAEQLAPSFFPALAQLHREGAQLVVLGAGPAFKDDDSFRIAVGDALEEAGVDRRLQRSFLQTVSFQPLEYERPEAYAALAARVELLSLGAPLFVFGTAPSVFGQLARGVREAQLVRGARVLFLQPFGTDLMSAFAVQKEVGAVFPEDVVFRADAALGREGLRQFLALRCSSGIFAPLWHHSFVDHVQITVADPRAGGKDFDVLGATKDGLRGQALQLLSLAAMDSPARADAVADAQVEALRAVRLAGKRVVRGQYEGGSIAGRRVRAYPEEHGVRFGSRTESFVALKFMVETWRWRGVPFYVRVGRRLPQVVNEIVVWFREGPRSGAEQEGLVGAAPGEFLRFRFAPEQSVTCYCRGFRQGAVQVRGVELSAAGPFVPGTPAALAERLSAFLAGDHSVFARWDFVAHAWRLVDALQSRARPLPYRAGSWGPAAAEKLIAADGRRWASEVVP